ncbi:hypothetical protein [Cupriavidus gilardii]|uniref:hypothetical protein n=1 Tax=Cupriavidus gilardii TaxID=82541 RepID=UPI0023EE000C|nr:hypothetical protein [Cupriavidus gilardii]
MLFPRRLTLALLCAPAFSMAVSHAAAAQSAPSLSLEETVALATTHAGDAESSRGAVEAAVQMAVSAGQLPDPVLKCSRTHNLRFSSLKNQDLTDGGKHPVRFWEA